MTTLFDRLRGRHGSAAAVDSAVAGEAASLALADSWPVDADPPSGPLLRDTLPSDSPRVSMPYLYPPGSMPLPPYRIRRGIGVGGFGEVYFAVSAAGKEVALKRIQRNLDVELRGVSHCLNLKHPNLVSLYDICRDTEDQAWVVMEYVAGPNLRQVLDDSPEGLSETEAQRWFRGIAAGVEHLHSAGLVHRDLKPGNVFDDLGTVKVGDYGLSKFISTSHRGGHTESVGTFHYMAPEIGRGQYGRQIDIYALGILLYELLTGRVPFDGESCHEIIVKHLTATPDLSAIRDPYRTAIARSLEKDPAQRPADVGQLLHLLGMTTPGTPAAVVRDPAPQREPVLARLAPEPAATAHWPPGAMAAMAGASSSLALSSPTAEEPVARAVRHSVQDLRRWWGALDQSPGAKIFLLFAAGFALLINTHWLLPVLTMLGLVYVPYYVVRQMVLHVGQQPSYAQAQRVATAQTPVRRALSRQQWREAMRDQLKAKHSVVRLAELSTSWIAATLATVALALLAGVLGLRSGDIHAAAVAPYVWMGAVVLVGGYILLSLGKLWERCEGEGLTRRVVLAGAGAGVGVFAYAMLQFLMLPVDQGLTRVIDSTELPQTLYFASGAPRLSAWMAHFALLFAAVRWWKPVDPLRRRRLSLWSVAVAVVAEWMVHQILPLPQPSGMLIAGALAIVAQTAAPWTQLSAKTSPIPYNDPRTQPGPIAGGHLS